MAPILVSAIGYTPQKLDDEAFQSIFDELQATKLPLTEGSVTQLVNSLQSVIEQPLQQQVRKSSVLLFYNSYLCVCVDVDDNVFPFVGFLVLSFSFSLMLLL